MEDCLNKYICLYSKDLTKFCISICNNVTDAEDLFQETWYKAIKNFKKYDEKLPFDKWLFTICANTYKDSIKLFYNKKKLNFDSNEEKEKFLNSIPCIEKENPDNYYEIHKAIMSLPKKLKITLCLYYFKEYSIKEISEILKIPEGTVKSRLNSAKKIIKGRLENEK